MARAGPRQLIKSTFQNDAYARAVATFCVFDASD